VAFVRGRRIKCPPYAEGVMPMPDVSIRHYSLRKFIEMNLPRGFVMMEERYMTHRVFAKTSDHQFKIFGRRFGGPKYSHVASVISRSGIRLYDDRVLPMMKQLVDRYELYAGNTVSIILEEVKEEGE
jgi:hypothetical protein